MEEIKVLNFGSLNIDYVYAVEHFVRPGETMLSQSLNKFCGGKGLNQSIALGRAGSTVYHAGKIGSDGAMLKKALNDANVNTDWLYESAEATGHAIIQVDKCGQNSILLHSGANYDIDCSFVDKVFDDFSSGDILLIQNEINNIPYIMNKAWEKGMRIAFNPSPINDEILKYPLQYVKWFILNEVEGNDLTGKTKPVEIADTLLSRYPDCSVVLTLGSDGVYYKDAYTTFQHGIYKVKCVDSTAAGDTFTGYFISGVVKGLEVSETLRIASIASSIAVSRAGASSSIPTIKEVESVELELA